MPNFPATGSPLDGEKRDIDYKDFNRMLGSLRTERERRKREEEEMREL